MGQVLHGSATTTEAVRRAIQRSQESVKGAGPAPQHQPHHRSEVAQAPGHGRCGDGAQAGPLARAHP